ncbi:PAS domain S-box-containing protein [Roseimicrobium gellanilyticum]|uniref:PAS domain S-box-containing protein n=1 Tax=Roseimicrobium gellanilyticum TaxID=748857 RepID=A0A366HVC9_9BACT|nr:PAS domain S-box protein [Roseimicrobium gellanilyticum]RBP47445.1 PAS domain S-box-containing protein [Roseimicrobium gellanilyticum]
MKLLFDNAPVAMAMFDTDMRYLLANRRWLEDFKLSKVDVTGRSQYDLFPSLHPGWRHVYNRALGGQVVRSDRDAITQDGKRVVYRWEVRPWRHMDTTIGGVTISCERLYQSGAPADAVDKSASQEESLWKTKMPLLALTATGRILRVSEGLAGTIPDCSKEEEPVFFWDAFAEPEMHPPVRRATLVALDAVLSSGESQASIFTYPIQENEDVLVASAPIQWLVSKLRSGLPDVEGDVALVVGLHGAVPAAKVEPVAENAAAQGASSQEWDQFTAEIGRLRQAHKEALDAAALSRQRETRLRAVLELAPCGLMVIDEHACAIYQNAQVPGLLGRVVPEGQPMHEWLAEGARDEQHRAESIRLWTEEIWRKRSIIPMPLTGADGLHREVEMRPVPLPGGGLLLMLQDVTESRRSEEMLRSTEAKFRTLVHENPLPVVLADRSGAVFDVNPACEQLLGHTRAEMRRMPIERWLDMESFSRRAAVLEEMTKRGERYAEFPVQVIHATEYVFPVQLRLAVVPDTSGQPMFTLHFFSPVPQLAASSQVAPSATPAAEPAHESAYPAQVGEGEVEAAVMKTSAALADAAARMKAFAPTPLEKAPADPVTEDSVAPPTVAEAPAPPLFAETAPVPDSPSVSAYDPVLSEPPPATEQEAMAQDPWSASTAVPAPAESHRAFDPWKASQLAEPVSPADPWSAPQAQSFASAGLDPWATPAPAPQVEPEPATEVSQQAESLSETMPAEADIPVSSVEAAPAEPVPPPATTPVLEEAVPIEEIPASVRPVAPLEEVRAVALLSTDFHGRITAWTSEAETRFGFSQVEMLGRGLHSLFRPSDSTGLHIEILALPGWVSASSSAVTWNFFHKMEGRQEATFTLIPLEQGGLALIMQEEQRVAIPQSAPELQPETSPEPASIVEDAPVQMEVAEPIIAPQEFSHAVPFEAPPAPASEPPVPGVAVVETAPENAAEPKIAEDEAMVPPPLLLDEHEAPEEWPAVPANLLDESLAPSISAATPVPLAFIAETFVQKTVVPDAPVAPLTLAPPQRMFADTPPAAPKPLSLAPPQSLYKDTTAAASVEAGLTVAYQAAPVSPPVPAPTPQSELPPELPAPESAPPAPTTPQQRPSFEELQRERVLLGETHHRVKNHLQIITSMLNLQMSTLHNEEARDALRSSQNRVRSIAALHQHLYLLTTGETADFRAFATGLISHLRECYHVPSDRVVLGLDIPEQAMPDEWLMPLALALNEMVSNAFKHAWPDGQPGFMRICLMTGKTPEGTPHGRLTVADDGIGLPPDFEQRDHLGMGMKILRVFAGQLGGEVRTRTGNAQGRGVSFDLVFPTAR